MKNMKYIVKEFIKVIIIVAIAIPVINLMAAATWTGPTTAPPGGNAEAPVNVGPVLQEKTGNLIVRGLGVIQNLLVGGNVDIGTTDPKPPIPNGIPENLYANDVYLRSTSQWVSQMSGISPPGYDFVEIGGAGVYLKPTAGAFAQCEGPTHGGSKYVGQARNNLGQVQVKLQVFPWSMGAGDWSSTPSYDSGWVNNYYINGINTQVFASALGIQIKKYNPPLLPTLYLLCSDLGSWFAL